MLNMSPVPRNNKNKNLIAKIKQLEIAVRHLEQSAQQFKDIAQHAIDVAATLRERLAKYEPLDSKQVLCQATPNTEPNAAPADIAAAKADGVADDNRTEADPRTP